MTTYFDGETKARILEIIDSLVKDPELRESEDERIRKGLIKVVSDIAGGWPFEEHGITKKKAIAYLEKQKEPVVDKEGMYYYLGGKFIYCGYPVMEENLYDFAISQQEKQKESLHIPETCKENGDTFTDIKNRNIRGCIGMALADVSESRFKMYGVTLKECLAYLERQKEPHYTKRNALFDKCVENCNPEIMQRVSDEVDEILKEQKPAWGENFEENIRILLHDKLTWHSEDGSISSTVLIDDKTLKDICAGIWFYVGKEALKYPNKELNVSGWSEEEKDKLNSIERLIVNANAHSNYLIGDKEAIDLQHFIRSIVKPTTKPAEWSEEDSDNLERVDNYLWMLDDYVGDDCSMPQGKTDKIRGNIHGILSPWLKSLPERFNPQPKQEWSDEDKHRITDAIYFLESAKIHYADISEIEKTINFLKSLRPSWKPSEVQKDSLERAIYILREAGHSVEVDCLEPLLEHLKKLM